jgi:hypothetical protein
LKTDRTTVLLASLVAVAGFLGGEAKATSLDVLVAGGTLTSDGGDILFSGFAATANGDLSSDLSQYDISALSGQRGLVITGPLSVSDGDAGTLNLVFDVTVQTAGLFLDGAGLDFSGTIADVGGLDFATVSEDLLDAPLPGGNPIAGDAALAVLAQSGNPVDFVGTDTAIFSPVSSLHVVKVIDLFTLTAGQAVSITSIEQTFSVIPEPGTSALMAFGLLALGCVGRPRR